MKIILAAASAAGHVNPILAVTRLLMEADHDVVVVSANAFKGRIEASGARFHALSGNADFDGTSLDDAFPERRTLAPGPAQIRFDLEKVTVDVLAAQFATLKALLREFPAELIISDTAFVGTWPFLLGATSSRPVIAGLGVTFLPLRRDDGAPTGLGLPPAADPASKARFADISAQIDAGVWNPLRQAMDAVLAALGARALPLPYLDAMVTLYDFYLQPTVRGFEYPRAAMGDKVHFVGPLPMRPDLELPSSIQAALAREDKRVVLVTQGTLANSDLGQLLAPALAALAHRSDLIVLATTGGRPVSELPGTVPANAFVERMLPFDKLMTRIDVLITNGGYGTVTHALGVGVPMVVAGLSEDKPEIAARVAWSGAGIDLHSDRPTPEQLREAVDEILEQPRYRDSACRLAAEATAVAAGASIPDLLVRLVRNVSTR